MLVGAALGGADAGWEDVLLERPESYNRPLSEDPPQDTIAGDEEESQ
jgi:hypothetical protein